MSEKKSTTRYVSKPSKVPKVKAPQSEAAQRPITPTGTGFYTNDQLQKVAERRESERRAASSTPRTSDARASDRRGAGVPKIKAPDVEVAAKAPKSNTPKKSPATAPVSVMSADARKKANQAARTAIRTNDPKAAKDALAGLPKGTKKYNKYAPQLEGIIDTGKGTAPAKQAAAPKTKAPKPSATPKIKAPKSNAPSGETRDPKLAKQLARARAANKKLKAAEAAEATAPAPEADTSKLKVAPGISSGEANKAVGEALDAINRGEGERVVITTGADGKPKLAPATGIDAALGDQKLYEDRTKARGDQRQGSATDLTMQQRNRARQDRIEAGGSRRASDKGIGARGEGTGVPKVTAPATTNPDAAKKAVHDVAPVQQPEPAKPTPKADTRSVAEQLAAAQAENNELKGVKGANTSNVEAPRADTSPADTSTAAAEIKASKASKKFHRARNSAFKRRQAESIQAKGIQTIPVLDTAAEMAETPEAATVRTRKLENDLLNAQAQESTAQPKPKPTASEGDNRTSTDVFGKKAVEGVTEKIAEAPRTDLTLTAAPKGTARYGVNLPAEDSAARAAQADKIRAASSKVRNVAISRGATPEILESLDRATESEHSRALDSYFDEVEAENRPMNQAGPRKADAPRRILTPTIDANAELTVARTSAQPPAPSDRKTIEEKIDLIVERGKPGGGAVYKGPEAIKALENLRDHGEASTGAEPRSTRVLPPGKDLVAEHFGPDRPSIRAARKAGQRAGQGRRPAEIPNLTEPGVVPAGPTTPPTTPAKLHARVDAPLKSQAQMWTKRMADWGRSAYQAATKKQSGPAIELAGEAAKAQGRQVIGAKTKATLGRGGVVGATLLAGLVAAETAKAAYDAPAGKKLEAAKETATQEGVSTAGTVAAIGLGVKALSKIKPVLGAAASGALSIAALPAIAKEGFDMGSLAGKEVAQIKEAKRKSARDKKYSDQFYGTVEKATKTRHAKEAFKRAQAKKEKK